MADGLETCAYCPQLCRHVCPVAVATGLEAATPAKIMLVLLLAGRGQLPMDQAASAALSSSDAKD